MHRNDVAATLLAVNVPLLEPHAGVFPTFLAGGGAMGARLRAHDWSGTPLGAPSGWPPPLKTVLRVMLTTHQPVLVFWGPQHLCFHNEAYSRALGPEQHPRALGLPGREVLDEIWHWLGPQLSTVMAGEGATGQPWHPNQRAPQTQRGLLEEVDWTCSYSPIDDATAASGVGGVLVLCEAGALARRMIGTPRDTTECKQADAQRDEFLATLGHELRNPLAPIGNALKVLNRDVAPSGSAGRAGDRVRGARQRCAGSLGRRRGRPVA